ncbi:MAG TPA: arabinan endo-1,5-alpha-L-arabinosidase [Tepidisphaeraceae bacterium]|jgi:arabinan endo-1,5-alpha-L-arabinosidase
MRLNKLRKKKAASVYCGYAAIWAALLFSGQRAAAQLPAYGVTGAHDPSTLTQYASNGFIYFATGQGIVSRTSTNMINWSAGPSVFVSPPSWTESAVPGFTGDFWAPEVSYFEGVYHLYYAVSTFGSQVSAIGMATSGSIDPTNKNYQWVDHGPVIESTNGSDYNTIDPSILVNSDGTVWMSFGSYWDGIYITQINPATGMRLNNNATQVADNSQIEASYLYQHNGYYYLFVNFGMCCMGTSSTYNIRVGRSTSITGPYLDENGQPMLDSGGTLLLGSEGRYIGPGQVGIMDENSQYWMSYHYYDGDNNGTPTYALEQMYWTSNNWPTLTPVPEAGGMLVSIVLPILLRRRRRFTTRI